MPEDFTFKIASISLMDQWVNHIPRLYNPHPAVVMAWCMHYDYVIMDSIASQITSLAIVYSTVHSGADQSKHQSSASLAFVWEIHRWPVNFPHKWPVTRKMFPFDDVIVVDVAKLYKPQERKDVVLDVRRSWQHIKVPDDVPSCLGQGSPSQGILVEFHAMSRKYVY